MILILTSSCNVPLLIRIIFTIRGSCLPFDPLPGHRKACSSVVLSALILSVLAWKRWPQSGHLTPPKGTEQNYSTDVTTYHFVLKTRSSKTLFLMQHYVTGRIGNITSKPLEKWLSEILEYAYDVTLDF